MRKMSPAKKTMTGASRLAVALAALLLVPALAAQKPSKTGQPYALVFGSVFRETGAAMPGVKITLETADEKDRKNRKFKSQTAATDRRGEFALRVPAEPMRYTVVVQAPGYQDQRKPVEVHGDERVDLSFLMELNK